MDFARSVEYLLSLGNEVSAMKLGLKNIRTLLAALGNPHEKYLKVQVAGTNGKGSVCAFLDSICNEAGIATGTYTSPHLVSITERIRINGVDISEDEFARIADVVRATSESLLSQKRLEYRPTFFEQMTAIALAAFAEAKVELAILETGLGGRLDATTAANADIVAITRIDLDHQEYLGNTIEEIAAEKAAIINDESDDIVIGAQSAEALAVIMDRCRESGAVPVNEQIVGWAVSSEGSESVRVETTRYIFPKVSLGLKGRHQVENADTAIKIVAALRYGGYAYRIEDEDIVPGLENARHPGRLEYIGHYLLDGAHNPAGAGALREYLDEFEKERSITIVFGAMGEKDVSGIASVLFSRAQSLILTKPSNSRAMSAEELRSRIREVDIPQTVILADNVGEALIEAEARTPADGLILVTGSLYLVGEAKKLLQDKATAEI